MTRGSADFEQAALDRRRGIERSVNRKALERQRRLRLETAKKGKR